MTDHTTLDLFGDLTAVAQTEKERMEKLKQQVEFLDSLLNTRTEALATKVRKLEDMMLDQYPEIIAKRFTDDEKAIKELAKDILELTQRVNDLVIALEARFGRPEEDKYRRAMTKLDSSLLRPLE